MKYSIDILQPGRLFLDSLDSKIKAKVFRSIELLEEFGPFLREPHSKKLEGYNNLFELRIHQSTNSIRLFYFHKSGCVYIVTSGYSKKSQKLDKKEIEKAERIKKQFLEET